MAYRDDLDTLKSREASLEEQLTATRALIAAHPARRLPLENVRVASPCRASWDEMRGDERVRLCASCSKSVYNLSAMTRAEAEALLIAENGICIRLYRRADGTVMTADCPVGVRRRRVRRLTGAIAAGGAIAATAALYSASQVTMGQRSRPPGPSSDFVGDFQTPGHHMGAKYEMRTAPPEKR